MFLGTQVIASSETDIAEEDEPIMDSGVEEVVLENRALKRFHRSVIR